MFGISALQVEELAKEIILKDWKTNIGDKYIHDPRQKLWQSSRHERETWHSHSSYPKTDDYQFYLSYHGMLAVAAKLLQVMPVVHRNDLYENEWSEWLKYHSLTRSDNRWLADRRDPAPLQRRAWLQKSKSDNWRWEINQDDFMDGLLLERNHELWLNVYGHWSDNDDSRKESFAVASAFVNPDTSLSLLHALTTCSNSRDYKLPYYHEEDMEFKKPPFILEGWILRNGQSKYLDEFDPFAGDIEYPSYCPGQSILEQFGLIADKEQRNWYLPKTDTVVLISELWGDKHSEDRVTAVRYGSRIYASFTFIKNLCANLGRNLIIEVQIERNYHYRSYQSEPDDEIKYPPPYCKIYLISADGTLRDAKRCYRIGQSSG
ncbi:MAG: hypothetical protein ABSB19_00655 [Methylomonas sp.]